MCIIKTTSFIQHKACRNLNPCKLENSHKFVYQHHHIIINNTPPTPKPCVRLRRTRSTLEPLHRLPQSAAPTETKSRNQWRDESILKYQIYIYICSLIRTLSRDSSLVLTSKYSCLTCCKHLRHLQINQQPNHPSFNASIQQRLIWKQDEHEWVLRVNILLFTEVSESNASISDSLSPNAVAQENKYIKCNIN